jgi:hypothetical protein
VRASLWWLKSSAIRPIAEDISSLAIYDTMLSRCSDSEADVFDRPAQKLCGAARA